MIDFRSFQELSRLKYILDTRGLADAITFARQTVKVYRHGVMLKWKGKDQAFSHLSMRENKPIAIQTYKVCKLFLRVYDK